MKSVLQNWVMELTLMQQGLILTCIRGPDGIPKKHISKDLVKAFRAATLVNAHPFPNSFMGNGTGILRDAEFNQFFESVDEYPLHWFLHMMHGAELLGYEHPRALVRAFWGRVYNKICKDLHVGEESATRMRRRLLDARKEVKPTPPVEPVDESCDEWPRG